MTKKLLKGFLLCILAFFIFSATITTTYDIIIPDSISCSYDTSLPSYPLTSASKNINNGSSTYDYKLYGIIPLKSVTVDN